jgi:hypothetical protein
VHGGGDGLGRDQEWKAFTAREAELDVFVTADQNLSYQQPVTTFELGFAVLRARTTKLEDLLPLVPSLLEALDELEAGQVKDIKDHKDSRDEGKVFRP